MKIGFVGSTEIGAIDPDDMILARELEKRGGHVDYLCWDNPLQKWTGHDLYINRCTWRYPNKYNDFVQWLNDCIDLKLPFYNSPRLQLWNTNKLYLRDLQDKGIAIVPSLFFDRNSLDLLEDAPRQKQWHDLICKPSIGASGNHVNRYSINHVKEAKKDLAAFMSDHPAAHIVVQPYMEAVRQGEWSLIFFQNQYSHAVLKKPAPDGFKVQERWGGSSMAATPPSLVIDHALEILNVIGPDMPLYARVDGFIIDGQLILAELEVCEPYLWLHENPSAASRFADALMNCSSTLKLKESV